MRGSPDRHTPNKNEFSKMERRKRLSIEAAPQWKDLVRALTKREHSWMKALHSVEKSLAIGSQTEILHFGMFRVREIVRDKVLKQVAAHEKFVSARYVMA